MTKTRAVVPAWPTGITGELPSPRPLNQHNAPQPKTIARRFELIDTLGIEVPADARAASETYEDLAAQRADDLAVSAVDTDGLAEQLASSDVTAEQAASQIAKAGDPRDTREARKRIHATLTDARKATLANAANSLTDAGEGFWLDQLRPIVSECLDDPRDREAEDRWAAVYELAAAVLPLAEGAKPLTNPLSEHRYAKPDEAYWYRVENARRHRVARHWDEGPVRRVEYRPSDPPALSLAVVAEHRDEWQPGLYTAEQTIANVKAILAREDEAVAAALGRAQRAVAA